MSDPEAGRPTALVRVLAGLGVTTLVAWLITTYAVLKDAGLL